MTHRQRLAPWLVAAAYVGVTHLTVFVAASSSGNYVRFSHLVLLSSLAATVAALFQPGWTLGAWAMMSGVWVGIALLTPGASRGALILGLCAAVHLFAWLLGAWGHAMWATRPNQPD